MFSRLDNNWCYSLFRGKVSGIVALLPSAFLKIVGVCLIIIGVYDTNVYGYALKKGTGSFDFFGRELSARHPIVRLGFASVLFFYFAVGALLVWLA